MGVGGDTFAINRTHFFPEAEEKPSAGAGGDTRTTRERMERFVGGARVTGGARRQLSVGALGVGRRSVASVGLGRPQRTRGSLQQARGTLSSGELEKPERPNVTERPVPEPIVPEQTIETLDTLETLETLEPQVDAEEIRENLAHVSDRRRETSGARPLSLVALSLARCSSRPRITSTDAPSPLVLLRGKRLGSAWRRKRRCRSRC